LPEFCERENEPGPFGIVVSRNVKRQKPASVVSVLSGLDILDILEKMEKKLDNIWFLSLR
jgi:hypothetical protein